MENTLFFWVLPAIFVVFAAMFVTMGRIDRGNDSARWAATAFIIGSIGVLIDSGRSVSPVWVFALTVPMHWVVVFCVVQAFMLRHGQGISKHLIWTVFGVGNTINLLAIFVLHSPAIRLYLACC